MSRAPYVSPTLHRHRSGAMNKMGAAAPLRPERLIDGVPVEELVEAYGSPQFVYSERVLVDNYRALHAAMVARWPKVQLAWSYKTCYLDAIVRILHREGAWAEVVSEMEYDKAVRNGVPTDRILFNGPSKGEAALEKAVRGGARIHVDHFDELALLERVAARLDARPGVTLRLNFAAGTAPRWDRFGFDLDNGQADDAVARLVAGGRLRLIGLHAHLGTFVQDVDAYREAAGKIGAFAKRLREERGIRVSYVDLGGGFASTARLKGQYLPPEQTNPGFPAYAEAIASGLQAIDLPADERPTLFLETGRAVVDEAGWMITSVLANKRLADGRRAMIVDAGVNVLFTSNWYRHDVVPTAPFTGTPEPTVIYGPLCMNIDVVSEHLMMPVLTVGSRLLVHPVGAYNVTQSMSFIHLQPPVVLIGAKGQHGLIRRAQTLEDLTVGESLPAWLEA